MQEDSTKLGARGQILQVLTQADDWVSGEDLADKLGGSRAAVGKRVAQLRREGYYIQSSTRKGFWLRVPAERIDPALVARDLATARLGRKRWLCLEETTSTNTEAAALALDSAEAGTVVTAESQSRGKGRKGHAWFSSPRGLQFSLILPPEADTDGMLTKAAQQALIAALQTLAPIAPTAKAPNDILLAGSKIAGILVETGLRGAEVDWLVLGVGCNVNVVPDEFPSNLAGVITSVFAHTNTFLSKNRLLAEFLNLFEQTI